MTDAARGSAREKNGRFYVRARYGRAKRLEFRAPWARRLEDAEARGILVAATADRLIAVGRRDLVRGAARELAEAATAPELARVQRSIEAIMKGARVRPTEDITFGEWAKAYTEGELATEHPDYVKARDHSDDKSRLNAYILKHVADVPVVAFELRHALLVLANLPPMSEGNRRQVAQVMGRLMHLAVFPGQIIKVTPLPRGWMPRVTKRKHYSCLFPVEEAKLLAHKDTSEAFRLFCGVLNREGMRLSELLDCEWEHWGLEGRTFMATLTKTDDPRMWATRPDVALAMSEWKKRNPDLAKPFAYVDALGDRTKLADRFRKALKAAGISRPELFTSTEHTGQLRAHDMRATFVTISLAEGKSETWIRDRTAHKSTSMVDRYRRLARQVAELKLGSLVPLDEAMGWGKGGGIEASADVPGECLPGGEADGILIEDPVHAEVAELVDAADSKFALTSPPVPGRPQTPGEEHVAVRAETAFPHASPTPTATSRDVVGGLVRGEFESSTRESAGTRGELAAPEPKFPQPSPGVASRAETPVESDVAARAETGFHHSSTTPLATSRDAGGGITPGELDSTTARSTEPLPGVPSGAAAERSQALVDVATSLAVQRATWDAFDALEASVAATGPSLAKRRGAAERRAPAEQPHQQPLPARVEPGSHDVDQTIVHRDVKPENIPENIPGPAKARERGEGEIETPDKLGGRRG